MDEKPQTIKDGRDMNSTKCARTRLTFSWMNEIMYVVKISKNQCAQDTHTHRLAYIDDHPQYHM